MNSYQNKDESLLVLPSDHVIQDIKAFHDAINVAVNQSVNGKLVTFGVIPESPNTEYGYIKIPERDKKNKVFYCHTIETDPP